jgi:diguanylate cyclase (GGDEF)-like protein
LLKRNKVLKIFLVLILFTQFINSSFASEQQIKDKLLKLTEAYKHGEQNDLDEETNLKDYEKQVEKLTNYSLKLECYMALSNIYSYQKKYNLALKFSQKHYNLYQLEFEKKFKKTINEMNVIFDITNKEMKNKQLMSKTLKQKSKIEIQKNIVNNQSKWLFLIFFIFISMIYLIFTLIKTYKKVKLMANTDELTKISNRRTIINIANKNFKNEYFCVTIFDIDKFKSINDTYGHSIGDEVLRTLSSLISNNLRENDHIGRFGGEEFLIISKSNLKDTIMMAKRIRELIENYDYSKINKNLKVTSSFGVAEKGNFKTLSLVINRADELLYKAKKLGRNMVCY